MFCDCSCYTFFCKSFAAISIKIARRNKYLQTERQKTGVSTIFNYGLACIWFVFTKKKYFETVILKLNCTFQTSSMVSTMSKYQLFKKNINFLTPGFSENGYISKANKDITCSPFDMSCVTPPGNLLNLTKLLQLFPTGSKNL